MEWLQEILKKIDNEDLQKELSEAVSKEIPKHFMVKGKFNEVNDELKTAKGKLEETNKMIEDMKANASSVEETQKQLDEWKGKYNEYEKNTESRILDIQKKSSVKSFLSDKMTKSAVNLVIDKIDLNNIELDDKQSIKNSDTFIETLKGNYDDLFIKETSNSANKGEGTNNSQTPNGDELSAAARNIMGLTQPK